MPFFAVLIWRRACCEIKIEELRVVPYISTIRTDENVKELIPKLPPGKTPTNLKSLCIIIAYMLRMNEIEENMQEDLQFILSKAPYIMEQML